MTTIRLTPAELPLVLRNHQERLPKAILDGIHLAAHRGRAHLVSKSPVDQGLYRNSWQVKVSSDFPEIVNDSPHAGIIENGARPHHVNAAGIAALAAWAKRKLLRGSGRPKRPKLKLYGIKMKGKRKKSAVGGSAGAAAGKWARADWAEEESIRIAFAIAKKIEKYGQQGKFVVAHAMPQLVKFLQVEVAKQVKKTLEKKGF